MKSWYGVVAFALACCWVRAQVPAVEKISGLSNGTVSGNMYANPDLGLRYQLPGGWTVGEKETAVSHQFAWVDDPSAKTPSSSPRLCSKNLLFVTKHPEGMKLNSFDPMALVIAADPTCFREITYPKSVKEREAIQKSASQFLSHLQAPGSVVRGAARVRAFDNAGKVMLEISRPLSITTREVTFASITTIQNVNRSILTMPVNGYWVIWIFVSGDDVDMTN
jgi:hypothetical protein